MPNLTLHFSGNIEAARDPRVLAAVNAAASDSGLFDEADIKSRAVEAGSWQVGTASEPRGFVHLTVAIAPRPQAAERALSEALADALERAIALPAGVAVQVCVEILHVDTATYVKRVRAS